MITKPSVSGKEKMWQRQKLFHSLVLRRSFSNFSTEASYTNCYPNTLEQRVPLLRTLKSAFLMWQFNWVMKILCVDYIPWLLNIAPDFSAILWASPAKRASSKGCFTNHIRTCETPEFLPCGKFWGSQTSFCCEVEPQHQTSNLCAKWKNPKCFPLMLSKCLIQQGQSLFLV